MLKKLGCIFFLLFLLGFLFTNVVGANENENKGVATQEETKHFLKKYLRENNNIKFKEKDIYQIEPLFNAKDELLGYHYKLINDNNEDYFFIVSAQKIYSPILAAGEGKIEEIVVSKNNETKKYFMGGFTVISAENSNHLLNYIQELNPQYSTEEILDGLIVEENIDAAKQWDVDFSTESQEEINNTFEFNSQSIEEESSDELIMEENIQEEVPGELIVEENVDETAQADNEYITEPYEEETVITNGVSNPTSKVLNVPFFNQFDPKVYYGRRGSSCGPATQSAILEYWKLYKGKSGIRGTAQFGSKGAFINYMYDHYGGSPLGMSISNVGTGVVSQAQKGGYQATRSTFNSFTSYMTEIKNYRPMAVKFDKKFVWSEPNRDYAYSYHWTVGVGYFYDSGTLQKTLKVHTNGGTYSDGTVIASKIVSIDYPYNAPIISMIKFTVY